MPVWTLPCVSVSQGAAMMSGTRSECSHAVIFVQV
eukprot:COSAG04_NODE_6687_length_1278_cov_1.223919_1_plen_34_part_10